MVHPSLSCPKIHPCFLSLHSLWPLLLRFSPIQLGTAFCSVRLAQQETLIAISSSQATSPWPDESREYFRCAALSLAASFAEMLWVIMCMLESVLLLGNRRRRAAARIPAWLLGLWVICVCCAWDMRTYLCGLFKFCRWLIFQRFPWNQQISVFLANLSVCVFPTGDSMISSPSGNWLIVLLLFHMRKCLQW